MKPKDLAKELNVNVNTIYLIQKGKQTPSVEFVGKVLALFDAKIEDFLDDGTQPKEESTYVRAVKIIQDYKDTDADPSHCP